jgi:DNA-binding transcriptional MerR regulator
MRAYSTIEVAKLLDVTSDTLHRWIREKVVEAPPLQVLGRMRIRLWSEEEVEKARRYKAENYQKKPRRKSSRLKKGQS